MSGVATFRAVFLSDVHLGTRASRVGLLLDFLRELNCEHLYLVGDVIDLESLRRSFFWPTNHTDVLKLLLKKSRDGMRITYIPGNHDSDFRALVGVRFGNIEIARQCVHTTRAGKRLLVLHGDEFDAVIKCAPLAVLIGAAAYPSLLALNRLVHWFHELLGRPYWSLAQHVKSRLGNARRYITEFQRASLLAAKEAHVDGVVCGHIHRADLAVCDGLLYCNDGDWVESCTALAEDQRGALSLITWRARLPAVNALEIPVRDAA